jgi:preprotein translocase subunit SecA
MVDRVKAAVKERDEAVERGEDVGDTRPGWRVLRAAIWQQFGSLTDVEKRWDGDRKDLLDYLVKHVAASLIQQRERLYDLADARMAAIIESVLSAEKGDDEWDWDELEDAIEEQFAIQVELNPGTPDEVATHVWPEIEKKLAEREKELGRPWLLYFQRHFTLEEIDQQWIEHLKTMDALREGIGLQGYGQKDPKKEYKRIGFDLFAEMMGRIQANTINKVFKVKIQREEEAVPAVAEHDHQMEERGVEGKSEEDEPRQAARPQQRRQGRGAAPGEPQAKAETVRRERPKVGRNDPCPCGSGKKYKKCHGKDEEAAAEG